MLYWFYYVLSILENLFVPFTVLAQYYPDRYLPQLQRGSLVKIVRVLTTDRAPVKVRNLILYHHHSPLGGSQSLILNETV